MNIYTFWKNIVTRTRIPMSTNLLCRCIFIIIIYQMLLHFAAERLFLHRLL